MGAFCCCFVLRLCIALFAIAEGGCYLNTDDLSCFSDFSVGIGAGTNPFRSAF